MGHRQSRPGIDIPSAQCQTATQDVARQLFAAMGIERNNTDKRQDWVLRGFHQFDAPVCVIITYDRVLAGSDDTPFDCGAVATALVWYTVRRDFFTYDRELHHDSCNASTLACPAWTIFHRRGRYSQ
jgi:hypothetical protein